MTKFTKLLNNVPQTEKPFGVDMVKNDAGGYVFEISDKERLMRFLILGSDSDTYYAKATTRTIESAEYILKMIKTNCKEVVDITADVSFSGRAPKNDSAIFVLAMCCAFAPTVEDIKYAFRKLNVVCRTGTHLFQFVDTIQTMRGTGSTVKKGISEWYKSQELDKLIYQVIKYRNREGWTHRDVLRIVHTKPTNEDMNNLFNAIVHDTNCKVDNPDSPLEVYNVAMNMAKGVYNEKEVIDNLIKYHLPHECLPMNMRTNSNVWEALLMNNMPLMALIRNLSQMSRWGILNDFSDGEKKVVETLNNDNIIKKSRIHPLSILVAYEAYRKSGYSYATNHFWHVNSNIVSALESAFYKSFENVEPTNKKILVGLDVSGSMGMLINNTQISSACVSAAFAMTFLRTEPFSRIYGFNRGFVDLGIRKDSNLQTVLHNVQKNICDGTDCAAPIQFALDHNFVIDTFIIFTDNETWGGKRHPYQVLNEYREKINPNAKLAVCATDNNAYSIADRRDRKSTKVPINSTLNLIGFDSAWPQLIHNFMLS